MPTMSRTIPIGERQAVRIIITPAIINPFFCSSARLKSSEAIFFNFALIGKPNAGKSSILNGLLEENKAIVTNIPGTTRDVIEGKVILDGIVLNFIDTAGIRETDDVVEKIGVQKSLESAENADLRIYVLDNSEKLDNDTLEFIKSLKDKKLVFVNKNDLDGSNNYDHINKDILVYVNTII